MFKIFKSKPKIVKLLHEDYNTYDKHVNDLLERLVLFKEIYGNLSMVEEVCFHKKFDSKNGEVIVEMTTKRQPQLLNDAISNLTKFSSLYNNPPLITSALNGGEPPWNIGINRLKVTIQYCVETGDPYCHLDSHNYTPCYF